MKGVTFGNYHSYDDFNLILSQKTIGTPLPKTNVIDIAGGDGVLDLTEYFGDVKYNNRSISFDFSTTVPQAQFMDLFSQVQNALHGQKMRITLDDDPDFYYVGRISVSEWKADKSIGKLTIDCDCEPWKYKQNETVVSVTVDGVTRNFYNVNDILQKHRSVNITNDDFVHFDLNNNLTTYSPYAFSRPNSMIQSNTEYKILFELYSVEKLNGSITFMWRSDVGDSYKDRFNHDSSKRLLGYIDEQLIFSESTKNSSEFSNANVAIRYWIAAANETSGKLKIRVSILPEETDVNNYEYVSYDGLTKWIRLANLRKKVVPTITASVPCTILFENKSFAINAGTFKIPEIELKYGINDIAVRGLSTVTFSYQEGGL